MTPQSQRSRSALRPRLTMALGVLLLAMSVGRVAGGDWYGPAPTAAQEIDAITAASSQRALTPGQTEGPYYRAGSPETQTLAMAGAPGTPLTLTGQVVGADGQPIAGAWVDFWQADGSGQYDNSGYAFRGHQYTDSTGSYRLETVVPGQYPGRARHIHVKVQAPGGPILTTQLYIPDDPGNAGDRLYNPALAINVQTNDDSSVSGTYTFVVARP